MFMLSHIIIIPYLTFSVVLFKDTEDKCQNEKFSGDVSFVSFLYNHVVGQWHKTCSVQ
jgi:hypothetical protein